MSTRTIAFVGAAGGVGTTRLTLECGATLARAGRDVAVFEVAFATQGLASYVDGTIRGDATALATGDIELEAALYEPYDPAGTLALCPARGPFERVARAQTAGAARRLEQQFAAASLSHDIVLVDTPPVCSNQALAAVNESDRTVLVTTGNARGRDALARIRERLGDIGATEDAVITTRTADGLADSDAHVPEHETVEGTEPACLTPDSEFAPSVAEAVEVALDTTIELDFPEQDGIGIFQ